MIRFAFFLAFGAMLCLAVTAMLVAASRAAGTPFAVPFGVLVAVFGVFMVLRERA